MHALGRERAGGAWREHFWLRRVRPVLEATAYKYFGLRLCRTSVRPGRAVRRVRGGEAERALNLSEVKPPIGLERCSRRPTCGSWSVACRRASRRTARGRALYGELWSRASSTRSCVPRKPMLRTFDGDPSTGKDVVGRAFFCPFAANASAAGPRPRRGGSTGNEQGTLARDRRRQLGPRVSSRFRYRADGTA